MRMDTIMSSSSFQNFVDTPLVIKIIKGSEISCCEFIYIKSPRSGACIILQKSNAVLLGKISTIECVTTLSKRDDCNVILVQESILLNLSYFSSVESENNKVISNVCLRESSGFVGCFNASNNEGDRGPLFITKSTFEISDLIIEECIGRFMVDFVLKSSTMVRSLIRKSRGIASNRSVVFIDQTSLILRECTLICSSENEDAVRLYSSESRCYLYKCLIVGKVPSGCQIVESGDPILPLSFDLHEKCNLCYTEKENSRRIQIINIFLTSTQMGVIHSP